MLKKNILSSTIAVTMMATSLLTPAITHAQTYSVERAQDHKQKAQDTIAQTMNIHDRPRSQDLVTLWMAPENECNAEGDGTKENPLCNFSQLSDKLDELYKQGKARGDVDIRFKTGKDVVYTPPIGGNTGVFKFSPTAGHVVRFVPDWYENVEDLETMTMDKMVKFKGNPKSVAQNRDSNIAIRIEPRVNRGGTYQISGLHFDTFINPLSFINTHMTKDKVVDKGDPESVYKQIRYSKNAAFNHLLISHNYFDKIGSVYTDQGSNYLSSSLRLWGITNSVIQDNTFINGNAVREELGPSHVIYTYMSADDVYDNNTFKDNVYSGPKIRVANDEMFTNNLFDHPKSGYQLLLTGYQDIRFGKGGERDNKQYAECKGTGPYYENLGNTFKQNKVNFTNNKEQQYCVDTKRITAPMFVEGVQTGDFEYSLRWGEADTLGDGVKSYHVYVGDIDKNGNPVEEPIHLKTVDATTRELTMTKDMLEKAGMKPGQDFYYYVVAEGNSGWTSGRTQHRMTINLDEKYKGREHYNVARSESFDRLHDGKKPEKTTFSYDLVAEKLDPTYGEQHIKPGEKISAKISLDKIPVYTTFNVKDDTFPGKISINQDTGEINVDTTGVDDGNYKIEVEVQYGDWSIDTAVLDLTVSEQQSNENLDSTDTTVEEAGNKDNASTDDIHHQEDNNNPIDENDSHLPEKDSHDYNNSIDDISHNESISSSGKDSNMDEKGDREDSDEEMRNDKDASAKVLNTKNSSQENVQAPHRIQHGFTQGDTSGSPIGLNSSPVIPSNTSSQTTPSNGPVVDTGGNVHNPVSNFIQNIKNIISR